MPPAPFTFGERELARLVEGTLFLQSEPRRLTLELADLIAADDHRLRIRFTCLVQPVDEGSERQMLRETFLSEHDRLSSEQVAAYFCREIRAEMARLVLASAAPTWLSPGAEIELSQPLAQAVQRLGFGSGLAILPPFGCCVESPSWSAVEQERARQAEADRLAEQRERQLHRRAALLKQWHSVRQSLPQGSTQDLMLSLDASDRSDLLKGMLTEQAAGQTPARLLAVAGTQLAELTGRDYKPLPATGEYGPFRSIQSMEDKRVGIGAQRGVILLDSSQAPSTETYAATGLTSSYGFNAVVVVEQHVFASHFEKGVMTWTSSRESGQWVANCSSARNLRRVGGELVAHNDSQLFRVGGESAEIIETFPGEQIVTLLALPDRLLVVCRSGRVVEMSLGSFSRRRSRILAPRVTAAALLPFSTAPRVLLGTEDGLVLCVGLDDQTTLSYAPVRNRGCAALTACSVAIAALSADRQHLTLFSVDPALPPDEIDVGSKVRQRIADLAYLA